MADPDPEIETPHNWNSYVVFTLIICYSGVATEYILLGIRVLRKEILDRNLK